MVIEVEIEHPQNEIDDHFEERQPQAASEQEPRQLGFGLTACAGQEGTCSCQEDKGWRAVMSDPPCQEDSRGGLGQIGRVLAKEAIGPEVADMIEGHDNHDHAAKHVDAIEPIRPSLGRCAWYGRFRNGRGETGAHCASSCSNAHDANRGLDPEAIGSHSSGPGTRSLMVYVMTSLFAIERL